MSMAFFLFISIKYNYSKNGGLSWKDLAGMADGLYP